MTVEYILSRRQSSWGSEVCALTFLTTVPPKGHTSLTFPPEENKNISLDSYSLLLIFKFLSSSDR